MSVPMPRPILVARDVAAIGASVFSPLAHHIARSHQGALEVGESSLGGARFDLRIPAEDD